jgi:Family of unknown function (DUF5329)
MMRSLLLALCLISTAQAQVLTEPQRIDALIRAVEELPNAKFVRNDTEHDARKAGEHLRLKLRESRGRCRTAEDFIRVCASGSSVSGKPYQIRFADGSVQTSEAFLRSRLKELAAGR